MTHASPSPMARALELGRQALGYSSPNPAVGAVIVRDGEIIGEGHTQQPGGPHAEVVALQQAGDRARGATMYTTLEPCSHHGRTPPCAEAMVTAGLGAVEIAVLDPHPPVNGSGRRLLEQHGIATRVGDCADEATQHFQGYFKREETGLPLLIAKYAMSMDGRIASSTGDSRWITGAAARARVHELRAHVDAIITAAGTVIADDPQLTARNTDGNALPRQPLRVIADSTGRTPPTARLFSEPGKTLIATASSEACSLFDNQGENVTAIALPSENGRVDLAALLQHLGRLGAVQVMTEAGEELLGAFFDEGLVDQVDISIAPIIIGGSEAPGPVGGAGAQLVRNAHRFMRMETAHIMHADSEGAPDADSTHATKDIHIRGTLRHYTGVHR